MSGPAAAVAATLVGCLIVAFSQMTGKMATNHLHPVKVCALRFGLAAPFCYAVHVKTSGAWTLPINWQLFGMIGIIGILGWGVGALLFYTVMQKDSMHRVAPVCNSVSIFTVALSIVFLDEKFFPALGVVMVLLVVGIFFMTPSAAGTRRWGPALPVAVLVSLFWAVNLVMTKVYIVGVPKPAFVLVKMIVATSFHLCLFLFERSPINMKGFQYSLISAFLLVAGDILLMMGLDGLPASVFAPIFATVIPFGFLLSVVILKERPVSRNWAGMLLIFAAAAICGYYGTK